MMSNKYTDNTCSPQAIAHKWLTDKDNKYYLYFTSVDLYHDFISHFDLSHFYKATKLNTNMKINSITAESLYSEEGGELLYYDKINNKITYGNIKEVSYDANSEIIFIKDKSKLDDILELIDGYFKSKN